MRRRTDCPEPNFGIGIDGWGTRAAAPVFAPVQVLTPPERKAGAIEVVLVNGERVIVYGGASAELVRTVLAAVRPAC